ncbi:hypothetical protein BDQ94DRAFT_63637 [Aspergillus welwitschiae]|uniref:Uncharacterized protein n=1 Tax=Aspergillus welwitschiae TaxID=1341132 RepID=A0A3F3PVK1_9EURO|nr:hypothetical protein BDQ94DRAFT_63637 [Aspergillus welwitschiae]RDH30954.1 hypothetical protein BDQ94DRAFT_63637 [Aspergillus welwitschiae]
MMPVQPDALPAAQIKKENYKGRNSPDWEEAGIASKLAVPIIMHISPGQQMHHDWIVTLPGAWKEWHRLSDPPNPNSHSAAESTGSSCAVWREPSPVTDICQRACVSHVLSVQCSAVTVGDGELIGEVSSIQMDG